MLRAGSDGACHGLPLDAGLRFLSYEISLERKMHLTKLALGLVISAAFVTSAMAETTLASTAPTAKQTPKAYCTDLVTQFNATDTHAVAAASLAEAKDHASRGEMLCGTMPKTGVKELWAAFRTIGVEPK